MVRMKVTKKILTLKKVIEMVVRVTGMQKMSLFFAKSKRRYSYPYVRSIL